MAAQELEAAVGAACADLALPQPIPVSVLLGSLGGGPGGGIARDLMEAALHPEGHVPDTPARKVRREGLGSRGMGRRREQGMHGSMHGGPWKATVAAACRSCSRAGLLHQQ